jgi:hypothetical protein
MLRRTEVSQQMSQLGQTRFVRGRGTSAVRSISDIGARVCPTAAVVNVIFGVGHARV